MSEPTDLMGAISILTRLAKWAELTGQCTNTKSEVARNLAYNDLDELCEEWLELRRALEAPGSPVEDEDG